MKTKLAIVEAAIIVIVTALCAQGEPKKTDGESAAPPAATGVKVEVAGIQETRSKSSDESGMAYMSGLVVTLKVSGDQAGKASRYGKLKIEKAVDDKGTDLINKDDPFAKGAAEGFKAIEKSFGPKVENGFALDLRLLASKRQATKIAQVKGSFVIITGGKSKDVTAANVASLGGKEVQDPVLKSAGVTVKVESVKGNTINYTVSGNADSLTEVSLVDADGKNIPSMSGWGSSNNGPKLYNIASMVDLPAKTQLKLTVLVGAKPATVEFDLKNIDLP